MKKYDVLIIGAGFAGSVLAQNLASIGKKVLILEKKDHIGGNMYDYIDEHGIRVHKYGPHLFHTNSSQVFEYLSRFTEWYPYEHRVLGYVDQKLVPISFNLKSIEMCFDTVKANQLKEILIDTYGLNSKVTILELRKAEDPLLKELGDYVFENVFKHYSAKQWGIPIEDLDPAVTARVPILVSYEDRYFQDEYQFLPKLGYTEMFKNLLDHSNIEIRLSVDARDLVEVDFEAKKIRFEQEEFEGILIYTGALDEFLSYKFGTLPYRSEEFELITQKGVFQPVGTVNYPTPEIKHPYTRITEYKHMMETQPEMTTYAVEYPYLYDPKAQKGNIPYYPVFTQENQNLYNKYVEYTKDLNRFYAVGRLAEYKYYNMDAIVLRSLKLFEKIREDFGF